MAAMLLLFVVPALLALAAGWDLASFTIPNFLSLALIAAFMLFALATHMALSAAGWHVLAGLIGLVAGFALFALGTIGGGDAKLFATISLWLSFSNLADFTIAASLFGGALALAILGLRHVPLPAFLARQGLAGAPARRQVGHPLWRGACRRRAVRIARHRDVSPRFRLKNNRVLRLRSVFLSIF